MDYIFRRMSRKRLQKLLMGGGMDRNTAAATCRTLRQSGMTYCGAWAVAYAMARQKGGQS